MRRKGKSDAISLGAKYFILDLFQFSEKLPAAFFPEIVKRINNLLSYGLPCTDGTDGNAFLLIVVPMTCIEN